MHISSSLSRQLGKFLLLTLVASAAEQAFAQAVPDTATQLPGLIFQQNIRPEATHTAPTKPKIEAAPEPEIDQPDQKEQAADPSLSQKFPIKTIELQGEKHLPDAEVKAIIKPYENRDVSFVELRELAEKLTNLYRQAGFVTSIVYIGPQKIENGHVILKASEGIVAHTTLKKGEHRYFTARAVLPRIDDTDDKTFQLNDLKRSLRRVNDNPDLKVRATLSPGEQPEQTNVELEKVEEHFPFHVTPFWDNMGRASIGQMRYGITSAHNNLTGFGDQAFNSVAWSRYSFSTVTHYGLPVGKHGTSVNFDQSYSTFRLGQKQFRDAKIHGNGSIFSPSIRQELVNTDNVKLSADVAFDFMDLDTYQDKFHLSQDRLRVLRPGINFDAYDRWGRTLMRHEFAIGLDLFDATHNKPYVGQARVGSSRQGAGGQFFRYTGNVTRLQRMPFGTYAILRAATQLSPSMLVSAQQYQMGGTYTIRGYKEGSFIGDAAYLFSGEWRTPMVLFPKSWTIPKTNYKLRDNIQFVSFADMGQVFTNNPVIGVPKTNTLLGVGAGFRANLTKHLAGRIDFGAPLLGARNYSRQMRVHFGLESRLF